MAPLKLLIVEDDIASLELMAEVFEVSSSGGPSHQR